MADPKYTADDLVRLIRARYDSSAGWIVFEQLTNGTGWKRQARYADAVALQTFPSRGIEAIGFEVKVARSDLAAELKNPAKSAEIQKWCARWWLVVPDEEILRGFVLPSAWGVMIVTGAKAPKLKVLVDAPVLTPEPWTPRFCAAMFRKFQEGQVPAREVEDLRSQIDAQVATLVETRLEAAVAERVASHERLKQELEHLRRLVNMFEQASGIQISGGYHQRDLGNIANAVLEVTRRGHARGNLTRLKEAVAELMPFVEQAITALDQVTEIARPKEVEQVHAEG